MEDELFLRDEATPTVMDETLERISEPPSREHVDNLMELVIDEIDYGVVLLDSSLRAFWTNRRARSDLSNDHPLALRSGCLFANDKGDDELLSRAISAVSMRGVRKFIGIGRGVVRVGVAILPLSTMPGRETTMVMIGKRQFCEKLTVESFARTCGLTEAEAQVLLGLCCGQAPNVLAEERGVAVSTVRTQISSIRSKTETCSVDDLLRDVGRLPPFLSTLREA